MADGHKHHVLFPGKVHEAHPATKEIRRNHWLQVPILQIGHTALHNEVTIVPSLDRYTAARVLRDYVPHRGDYVRSVEDLMFTIEDALKHPRTTAIEISNAQVAVYALELQLPFLKEFGIQDK